MTHFSTLRDTAFISFHLIIPNNCCIFAFLPLNTSNSTIDQHEFNSTVFEELIVRVTFKEMYTEYNFYCLIKKIKIKK